MNIISSQLPDHITCERISSKHHHFLGREQTSQFFQPPNSALLLSLLKTFLFICTYLYIYEYCPEFEVLAGKVSLLWIWEYLFERTLSGCKNQNLQCALVLFCINLVYLIIYVFQSENPSKIRVLNGELSGFTSVREICCKDILHFSYYETALNILVSKFYESVPHVAGIKWHKKTYLIFRVIIVNYCSVVFHGRCFTKKKFACFQDLFKTNNYVNVLGNGVMQRSSGPPLTAASSALYSNTDFSEKNIFGNFSSLISELNFPLGDEFRGPQMTDACSFSEEHKVFNDGKVEKCADMSVTEADKGTDSENIQSDSLVNFENFKACNWSSSEGAVSSKGDKTFLAPLPPPNKETAVKHNRQDEFQMPANHDYENENFTSVFTKSLTSLYSNDSETSYSNDINMKCVVGGDSARLDEGEFSSDSIDSKSGTKKLRSDSISDQSFDSAFHIVEKPPVENTMNLHSLQTENGNMFSSDSESGCDGKKVQEELNAKATALTCFRYEPYELPNAFSAKQEAENEFSLSSNNQDSTFLAIGENSDSFSQDKPIGFNMPSFQWKRSNFSSGLRQSSVRGRLESRNQSYSTRKLLLVNQRKSYVMSNKNLRSVRGRRSRSIRDESSPKPISEKPYMKISALSVYATVQDGVVLSVKCKRYKRRSGKHHNKDNEKFLGDQNFEPNSFFDQPVNLESYCNSEEIFRDEGRGIKPISADFGSKPTELSSNKRQNVADINQLAENEIRELVAKLCTDYSLDPRDFDDPEQIKAVSVIDEADEAQVRRGRPRRAPVTEHEGSESESSSVGTSQGSFKDASDVKDAVGSHRILRSLPCRRSPRTLKNGVKGFSTHRYCTRNAENQMSADDSNIIGDLNESDKNVSIPQETDSSVVNDEDCSEISVKETSLSSYQEFLSEDNGILITDFPGLQTELRSASGNPSAGNELAGCKIETQHNVVHECAEKQRNAITFSNTTDGVCLKDKEQEISELVPCQEVIPKEPYVEDHALREPPSLVKVENEDSFFNLEKENEERENNIHEDGLSPRYLVTDDVLPRPDNPSDQNSSQIRCSLDSVNVYRLPQEASTSCLLTVSDRIREEDKKSFNIRGNHDAIRPDISRKETVPEVPVFLKTPKREPSASPTADESMTNTQDNFDDDCIVISVDDDDDNESMPQNLREPLEISPKKEFPDHHTKENDFPSIASGEGMDLRLLKGLSPGTELSVSKSNFLQKDERDESILRNLLLDSTDNISNVPSSAASSQDHSSPTPIITSVISLNGIKSISPSPPPQTHPDTLKRPSSVDSCSPFLSRSKYIKTMDMLPNHGHHDRDNSRDISHSSLASPSRDEKCDLRRLLSNENVSPSYSPKPPTTENRDPSWTKDPHQLKDNIKKLKNEIVYLQMMAEQKEKEKIAIVCFKRYKEEILKRMYKAYAYSLRNRLNEFLRPEDCPNDVRGVVNQSMMHSVQPNPVSQPPSSKYGDSIPPAPHRNLQYPSHCADTNMQDPKVKLSPRHQRFPPPGDYANNAAQRANYKLQISALESRRIPSYNDKLPAVESMVASASDNYGFDMRNVKESSEDRKSRLKASLANTILQKALASREAQSASMTESIANNNSPARSYPLNKSCNYATNHISMSNNNSTPMPKRYPCENIPLDMAMSRGALGKPTLNKVLPDVSNPYNGNTDSSHSALQMNTRNPKEGSSIQALLRESRGRSGNMIPASMWTVPNGENISHDQVHDNRRSEVKLEAAPVQRRPVETIAPMPRHENFVMGRAHSETSSASTPSAASAKASVPLSHHRCLPSGKDGATLNGVLDRLYSRKLEEGRMKGYASSSSANSTTPYGGRMIKNEVTVKNTANSGNGTISNNYGSGTINSPRCMGCGLSDAKFLCSGCRKDWYCSPQCQSLRWPEHSQTCAGRIYGPAPGSFS